VKFFAGSVGGGKTLLSDEERGEDIKRRGQSLAKKRGSPVSQREGRERKVLMKGSRLPFLY